MEPKKCPTRRLQHFATNSITACTTYSCFFVLIRTRNYSYLWMYCCSSCTRYLKNKGKESISNPIKYVYIFLSSINSRVNIGMSVCPSVCVSALILETIISQPNLANRFLKAPRRSTFFKFLAPPLSAFANYEKPLVLRI